MFCYRMISGLIFFILVGSRGGKVTWDTRTGSPEGLVGVKRTSWEVHFLFLLFFLYPTIQSFACDLPLYPAVGPYHVPHKTKRILYYHITLSRSPNPPVPYAWLNISKHVPVKLLPDSLNH